MDDVTFGSAILFGAWVFFITARPFRHKESSLKPELFLNDEESGLKPDADTWNCDLPLSDRNTVEKADRWVLR